MTDERAVHEPHLEVSRWFPSEVAAGAELTFQIRVTCPSGCDLRGTEVAVTTPEGPVMTSELVSFDQGINETGEVMLRAPSEVGDHEWSVRFRPQASEPPRTCGDFSRLALQDRSPQNQPRDLGRAFAGRDG